MTRDEIFREIEQTWGLVPSVWRFIPDEVLESEWKMAKSSFDRMMQSPDMAIMAYTIAVANGDSYLTLWFSGLAKLSGASDEDLKNAAFFVKELTGWRSVLVGSQTDFNKYKSEAECITGFIGAQMMKKAA